MDTSGLTAFDPDGGTVTCGIRTTIPEDELGRIEVVSDASWLEASTDGDGQVSFDEALAIRRLDLRGLGIEDLTGIESFQNLEEIDFRDNKVEHADMLTQLPLLHCLDMEGNPLKSFDVHGCQQVFSLCRFDTRGDFHEGTFEPQYKVRYGQANVSAACDIERLGSKTVDYTKPVSISTEMDYGMHLLREHTVGPGYPLVLMGIGLTDTEIEDGNYRRLMEVLFNRVTKGIENLPASEFREYFDIFYINFISPERDCAADIEWMNGMQTHIKEYEKSLSNYYGKDYMRQLSWKVFYYAHVIGYCHKSIGGKAGIGSDIFNGKSFDVGCGMYTGGFMVNGKPSEQLGGTNGIDLICKEYWKIDQ
ncbi:MAG: hypothetical protein ACI4TU_09330 [Candidatus Cryptobacteroides sp.]